MWERTEWKPEYCGCGARFGGDTVSLPCGPSCGLREMRMAGEFGGLLRAIKNASFFPPNHLSCSQSSRRGDRVGLCDVKAHPGPLLAGEWLTDLIKHKAVVPWGGVYIGLLRGSGTGNWESSKWIRWLRSHKALEKLWNSRLQKPRRKRWRHPVNWGPKEVLRWSQAMQALLVHWNHPIRSPSLSLPGPYLFSAHTPSPEAIVPIYLHPLPQTNAILYSLSCFLQVARVTMRVNKPSGPELNFLLLLGDFLLQFCFPCLWWVCWDYLFLPGSVLEGYTL